MKIKKISNTKKLTAKDRAKIKIVEFLANPDNGFLPWNRLCTEVCHYKNSRYLYKLFPIEERRQIYWKALEERRKNYAAQSAAVDYCLQKKAMSGDPAAIKLWYQKMEGWSEKQQHDYMDEALWQKMALLLTIIGKMKSISNDERARITREQMIANLGPEQEV
jgi:hypothetical protein